MTDTVIDGIDYPAELADDARGFHMWCEGFFTALHNLGVTDDDKATEILAAALPMRFTQLLAYQAAHEGVTEYLDAQVRSGKLVNLGGGKYIETDKYDVDTHGPIVA